MRNTLSVNRGDGTYAKIAQYSGVQASEWTWGTVFCDVDLDGYEDIYIANGHRRDLANSDALAAINRLPKAVDSAARLKTLHLFPPLALPHLAFRNRGDLTFEDMSQTWGFNRVGVPQGIALADLDNDGDLDVIVNNLNGQASLYRNDTTAPRVAVRLKGLAPNTSGIGARLRSLGGPVPVQTQEIQAGGRYLSCDQATESLRRRIGDHRVDPSWRSGKSSTVTNIPANSLCLVDEGEAKAEAEAPSRSLASMAAARLRGREPITAAHAS